MTPLKKAAKKAQAKPETATDTVRLFPSTRKLAKSQAATNDCSIAQHLDNLVRAAG